MTEYPEPCFDVAQLAHVELLTPRPEESLWFFRDLLGMQETAREGQSVYLRGFEENYHHSLKLTEGPESGMGHCAWRTSSPQALQRRVDAVTAASLGDGWTDGDLGHGPAFELRTPAGHRMELLWEVERVAVPENQRTLLKNRAQRRPLTGIPVRRIDHVNLTAGDVGPTTEMFKDVLGFRLREQVLAPGGVLRATWLSVSALVHEIAVMVDPVAKGRLHHLCFWYGTQQHIEDLVDVLRDHDVLVELGPGVHGTTRAKFLYVREPGGNRIELFGDTGYLILEPDFEPVTWDESDGDIPGAWVGTYNYEPAFFIYSTPPVEAPAQESDQGELEHA